MQILINKFKLGQEELDNIQACIDGNWFGGNSKFNKQFEEEVERITGIKHYQSTNSGSAAIEIAVQVLIQSGKLKRGDLFVHPAVTFPTSLSSAIMAGLLPVYVDCQRGTYQIDPVELEHALQQYPEIKLAIIPALLGNIPEMDRIKSLLGDRYLIVDSCDLMGGRYDGRDFITYGDMGAFSHYGSHHISTGGVGGGLATNDDKFFELIHSMTFWGRNFDTDDLDRVNNFLKRYSYKTLGLDAQMSALQAAIGVAQIKKLPELVGQRNRIFDRLQNLFSSYISYFVLPSEVNSKSEPSWFCYPLIVKDNSVFNRESFAKYLLDNNIEVRPIMAGDITVHPPFENIGYKIGSLPVAKETYAKGLFIPCCPMDNDEEEYYFEKLEGFLKTV